MRGPPKILARARCVGHILETRPFASTRLGRSFFRVKTSVTGDIWVTLSLADWNLACVRLNINPSNMDDIDVIMIQRFFQWRRVNIRWQWIERECDNGHVTWMWGGHTRGIVE